MHVKQGVAYAGMAGAIVRIQGCYNGAKTRDAYVFCLAMDTQAQRLERSTSTRMNSPMHSYFSEEAFDSRPGESMTRALAWGVGRARRIASDAIPVTEQFACAK